MRTHGRDRILIAGRIDVGEICTVYVITIIVGNARDGRASVVIIQVRLVVQVVGVDVCVVVGDVATAR